MNALEAQDAELCDEVIAFDDEIDERYHEHREEDRGAARPPDARRRRPPARARDPPQHIHLERIGDQCVTIAKLTKLSADLEHARPRRGSRGDGRAREEMIRVALDSFAARDVERARSLVDLDELIDRTNRRVIEQVLEMAHFAQALQEWGMRMIVVSRCLERIGDNAVDIGEQTASSSPASSTSSRTPPTSARRD